MKESPIQTLSKREANKRDRLNRIIQAADAIFSEKGYDKATTREIAQRAGVSVGSVFVYGRDKYELMMLIINQKFDQELGDECAGLTPDKPFIDQFMASMQRRYTFWKKNPEFAYSIVRETYGNNTAQGPEAEKFVLRIQKLSDAFSQLLREIEKQRKLTLPAKPELIIEIFLDFYRSSFSRWITGKSPNVKQGCKQLRERVEIVLKGLGIEN